MEGEAVAEEQDQLQLRWLLGHRGLELTPIVSGDAVFQEVQPTELTDPGEFLRPGALVLTVGLAFANNPQAYGEYVHKLAEAQVAAIGFGTGLVFDEVPGPLIAAARAAGVRRICTVGDGLPEARLALETARRQEGVWAACAIHPVRAGELDDAAKAELTAMAFDPNTQ